MKTFLDQARSLAQLQELEDLMLQQGVTTLVGKDSSTSPEFAESKATRSQKTKPKCSIGYSCGYSCIAGKKVCRSSISADNAAAILKALSSKPAKAKSDKSIEALANAALSSKAPATRHSFSSNTAAAASILKSYSDFKDTGAEAKLSSLESSADREASKRATDFKDLLGTVSSIAESFDADQSEANGSMLLAATSKAGRVSAAAFITKSDKGIQLEDLVGSPLSLVGSDEERADVKGGGSAMLSEIARLAIQHSEATGKPPSIRLLAIDSAVGFYEKLGATVPGPNPLHVFDEAAIRKLAGLG